MRKKIISIMLMIITAFAFAGCEKSGVQTTSKDELSLIKNDEYEKIYMNYVGEDDNNKYAYIFVDGDDIPELLVQTDTEYELYTIKDKACEQISLYIDGAYPSTRGFRNLAMCMDVPEEECYMEYSFDYVPYQNKIRIHSSAAPDYIQIDYYINLENMTVDLKTSYENNNWTAFKGDKKIFLDEFEESRNNLGYGDLEAADMAFVSIEAIDEAITYTDTSYIFDEFVREGFNDIICEIDYIDTSGNRVYKKFSELSDRYECKDNNPKYEYVNLDSDSDLEMVVRYDDGIVALDERFGQIYKLFESSMQCYDIYLCNIDGVNKAVFACVDEDRKSYTIYEIDSCGYIVDCSELDGFLDEEYFMYRQKEITKDEFLNFEKRIESTGKYFNSNVVYPATEGDADSIDSDQIDANTASDDEWKNKCIEVLDEKAEENSEYRYSLVYIDADSIPELLVDLPDNYISVYTFAEGESILSFDKQPYGVGGCVEYKFDPSCNLLCYFSQNSPSDFSYTYLEMKDDITIREKYSIAARCLDEAGNVIDDNGNPDSWKYYYSDENGQKEISKEEFDQYNRECQSLLKGEKIKNEILEEIK